MLRRLPISLRFDDDDSDFYYGFIEQKKNDRELSSLILDLLHVYYEDDEVKQKVDDYVINKSPYMHIHAELERIASEHNRQSVSRSMLGDFNDNARKKVVKEEAPMETTEEKKEEKVEERPLLTEKAVTDILQKQLAEMLPGLLKETISNQVSSIVGQQGTIPTVETSKTVEIPVIEKPIIETPTEIEVEDKKVKKAASKTDKSKVEKPTVSINIPTNEKVDAVKPKIATEEGSKVKKPASFGKLLNSVK